MESVAQALDLPGSRSSAEAVQVGVEEEFHVVDLVTRQLVPEASALLDRLPDGRFGLELQRSVVESNSRPHVRLEELRADLVDLRRRLADVAAEHGLAVVASGTAPLADLDTQAVSDDARYARMHESYRMAVREQLICGAQIHVDVPDREVAVAAMQWLAPRLPVLLAVSASSPYWLASDSGYASWRTQVWQRWPTAGAAQPFASAAEYDEVVAGLVRSGVISDPGMIYFDVRPSAHLPTLELRICDACPCVDDVVFVAGLFRAMTRQACAAVLAGRRPPQLRPEWLRAATWQAARSGLEGDLVDLDTMRPVPARRMVAALLADLRPDLEDAGDWELVRELTRSLLVRGTSAARQRAVFARTHTLAAVIEDLMRETRADPEHVSDRWWRRTPRTGPEPGMLHGYRAPADEALTGDGEPRPAYRSIVKTLLGLGASELTERATVREKAQWAAGVTFRVAGDAAPRVFPCDLVPRVLPAPDRALLERGLVQRVRALDAFLRDIHGPAEAVRDGVMPRWVLDSRPGLQLHLGRAPGPGQPRVTVAGIDLAHDQAQRWVVLEDNLRVPSGLAFGIVAREMTERFLPELGPPPAVRPAGQLPGMLLAALAAAAPPRTESDPSVALLTAGRSDAAFFEHRFLAERLRIPLVTPDDLVIGDDLRVTAPGLADGPRRIDVLYRRHDEDTLFATGPGAAGSRAGRLARLLPAALRAGTVSLANAAGNGVADDKVVYAFVPRLIEYYLGEQPVLDNIPTYLCGQPDQRAHVLRHLDELVLKPADGYGGIGVVIGPHATRQQLNETRALIEADPPNWVAQEVVTLSTHPTFTGGRFEPRVVDLRAFVFHGARTELAPVALTRVAPPGSMVVNSSRGGGAKDTWIFGDGGDG